MENVKDLKLKTSEAALWFIGQSGFICKSCDTTIVIDPYLSNSTAKKSPKLTRKYPPPIKPADLKADIYIVTHNHSDHLDPETIADYKYKQTTKFIAPRLATEKLIQLGIDRNNIITIDSGQKKTIDSISIEGIYAIPTSVNVIDTCGYLVTFPNGRSFYHSGDTGFSELLSEAAPSAEVGLFCINGKWGNMNSEQAAKLASKVCTKFAIPHHYDLMELNSENPELFKYCMGYTNSQIQVKILEIMKPFIWD